MAMQPWLSLEGLCPFPSCKPNGEASLPSQSTPAQRKSDLEPWGSVCLSLPLDLKVGSGKFICIQMKSSSIFPRMRCVGLELNISVFQVK